MASFTIEQINALSPAEFVELFGGVYDGSWWVAEAAAGDRPFLDFDHLLMVMRDAVDEASAEQRDRAIGKHSDRKIQTRHRSLFKPRQKVNLGFHS